MLRNGRLRSRGVFSFGTGRKKKPCPVLRSAAVELGLGGPNGGSNAHPTLLFRTCAPYTHKKRVWETEKNPSKAHGIAPFARTPSSFALPRLQVTFRAVDPSPPIMFLFAIRGIKKPNPNSRYAPLVGIALAF